jgi:hypothetical protein
LARIKPRAASIARASQFAVNELILLGLVSTAVGHRRRGIFRSVPRNGKSL